MSLKLWADSHAYLVAYYWTESCSTTAMGRETEYDAFVGKNDKIKNFIIYGLKYLIQ